MKLSMNDDFGLDKTKFKYLFISLTLLFFTGTLGANTMIIDDMNKSNATSEKKDYCEESTTRWCFVTDKVMGGVSEGDFKLKSDKNFFYYNMQGNVSTENNGGFIQFRTKIENHPENKLFDGIRIKVRGNNEEYSIHVRTKYLFLPWQYYEATFTANNDWEIITIPFKKFKKSNFYQPSSVSSIDVETIGIVAIGRNFKANIDLAFIELY
tara:strand:- start:372 stop:1001 length:630 start_codon:yes stop_codon:yes gene_type:complete